MPRPTRDSSAGPSRHESAVQLDGDTVRAPLADDFRLHHGPYDAARDRIRHFVGRDELLAEIVATLHNTRTARGSYLVAGYRGVGKTSVVNRALQRYKQEQASAFFRRKPWPVHLAARWFSAPSQDDTRLEKDVYAGLQQMCLPDEPIEQPGEHPVASMAGWVVRQVIRGRAWVRRRLLEHAAGTKTIRVNLGHDRELETRDVLCTIVNLLGTDFDKDRPKRLFFMAFAGLSVYLVASASAGLAVVPPHEWSLKTTQLAASMLAWPVAALLIVYLPLAFLIPCRTNVRRRLRWLRRRLYASERTTVGAGYSGSAASRRRDLPPLDVHQIELELQDILERARDTLWLKLDLIFVFDELDKISGVEPYFADAAGPSSTRNIAESRHAGPHSVGAQLRERKFRVDRLLSGLKSFITVSRARFFFVAGRELLDGYEAERGSTNALYETLFHQMYAVDSFLSDKSDGEQARPYSLTETYLVRRLLSEPVALALLQLNQPDAIKWPTDPVRDARVFCAPQTTGPGDTRYQPYRLVHYYHWLLLIGTSRAQAQRVTLIMRHFVEFLTVHSWGNAKRLAVLFESFVVPNPERRPGDDEFVAAARPRFALRFDRQAQQQMTLGSELYRLFHRNLSRQLSTSGDKLVVSTLATMQAILKFHSSGFSRYHLFRISETLNVYRSPELHTLTDTLLSLVLRPNVREVRNGMYRYRFSADFEEAMHFVSQISDLESAAFTFSLDAMENAKAHYAVELSETLRRYKGASAGEPDEGRQISGLHIVLGDFHALEQDYDTAAVHFQAAIGQWAFDLQKKPQGFDTEYLVRRVEAWLKLGDVEEHRQRYERAVSCYLQAEQEVEAFLKARPDTDSLLSQPSGVDLRKEIVDDGKFDILRQPFWARMFLHLKLGTNSLAKDLIDREVPRSMFAPSDARTHLRRAVLLVYAGDVGEACACGQGVIDLVARSWNGDAVSRAVLGQAVVLTVVMRELNERQKLIVDVLPNKGPDESIAAVNDAAIRSLCRFNHNAGNTAAKDLEALYGHADALEDSLRTGTPDFLFELENSGPLQALTFAARLLQGAALYFDAGMAYTALVSIWSMLGDSMLIDKLAVDEDKVARTREHGGDPACELTLVDFTRDTKLVEAVWVAGFATSRSLDSRASVQMLDAWRRRDLRPLGGGGVTTAVLRLRGEVNGEIPLANACPAPDPMSDGPVDYLDAMEGNTDAEGGKRADDAVMRASIWGQVGIAPRMLLTGRWMRFVGNAVQRRLDRAGHDAGQARPTVCGHGFVSHAVRFHAMNEWLDGRKQMAPVARVEAGPGEEDERAWKRRMVAALVSHYSAAHLVRKMSGNDQGLTFPPPAFIFFHMWEVVHELVRHETGGQAVPQGELDTAIDSVKWEIQGIAGQLRDDARADAEAGTSSPSLERFDILPLSACDLRYLEMRAERHLRAAERMRNVASRASAEVLRNQYYLHDDFNAPERLLDWALMQFSVPTANVLRRQIRSGMNGLVV